MSGRGVFGMAALTLAIGSAQVPAQRAGGSLFRHRSLNERIDSIFSGVSRSDSPGCAFGVFRGGTVLFSRAYGMADIERGVAISPTTRFDVGSITKQFTALSTLLLAEQGKISVDVPLRRYLPSLPAWGDSVLVRQLLNHTGGTGDYLVTLLSSGRDDRAFVSQDTAMRIIEEMRALRFSAGTEFSYSNSGFILLAEIVRRASGLGFAQYVDASILHPLGMSASIVMDDYRLVIPGRATGYLPRLYEGFWRVDSHHQQVGDGGLFTSLADLARWAGNFEIPIVGIPQSLALMQRPTVLAARKAVGYGYGLNLGTFDGEEWIWHGGAGGGFSSEFGRLPRRGIAYACLCNSGSAPSALYSRQALQAVLAVLGGI